MESQLRRDWNMFRFGFFWFGAVLTAAIGIFIFFAADILGSDSPLWYTMNLVLGPLAAYVIAWVGSAYLSVRVIAAMLFLVSVFATFLVGTMALHSLGFLALTIGTPDRPVRLPLRPTTT